MPVFDIVVFDIVVFDIVVFDIVVFDIVVFDIVAFDIVAFDIVAFDIVAFDIVAFDIVAFDIVAFGMRKIRGGELAAGPRGRMRQPIATGRLLLSLSILARRGLRSTTSTKFFVLMPGIVASSCSALTNPCVGHRP